MNNKKQHHFVTTWPRKNNCPQCGQLVCDGIDQGLAYRITPVPLNLRGELEATLARRGTYRLLANHLVRRDIDNITTETPTTRPPVYATHTCNPPNPAHISPAHVEETQRFITDKYLEKSTETQNVEQEALLTITDVLNGGHVTSSPDDPAPPF